METDSTKNYFHVPRPPGDLNNSEWNFGDVNVPCESLEWIQEGPIYEASEEDMRDEYTLIKAITDKKLWLQGPVKIIPPRSYVNAISEKTWEDLANVELLKPYPMRVRKIGKGFYDFRKGDLRSMKRKLKLAKTNEDGNHTAYTANATLNVTPSRRQIRNCVLKKKTATTRKKLAVNNKNLPITVGNIMENGDIPTHLANASADEMNAEYWKTIRSSQMDVLGKQIAVYGSDEPGTNSKLDTGYITLGRLKTPLQDICYRYGYVYPGITETSMYYGNWLTTFVMHIEDDSMFALNYLHYGAVKHWLGTRPCDANRVENLAYDAYNSSAALKYEKAHHCYVPLRHKILMPDPDLLRRNKIPLVKHDQKPGEFILVGPEAYHMGYNRGRNIAEAVNFVTKDWIYIGLCAKRCPHMEKTLVMTWFVYEFLHKRFHEYINGTLQVYHPLDPNKTLILIEAPEFAAEITAEYELCLKIGVDSVLGVATVKDVQYAFILCEGCRFWIEREHLTNYLWFEQSSHVVIPDTFFNRDSEDPPPILRRGLQEPRKNSFKKSPPLWDIARSSNRKHNHLQENTTEFKNQKRIFSAKPRNQNEKSNVKFGRPAKNYFCMYCKMNLKLHYKHRSGRSRHVRICRSSVNNDDVALNKQHIEVKEACADL